MKRRALLLCVVAVAAGGCQSVPDMARERFAQAETCPLERVEIRARADLKVHDLKRPRKPPAEVASDPARLAMWNKKVAEDNALDDSWDDVYELRGCGHQQLSACHRYNKGQGGVFCTDYDYPPNVSRW